MTVAVHAEELVLEMDDSVRHAIASIGRTEDISCSPDGNRLAIAAFGSDAVVFVDMSVSRHSDARVAVHGLTIVSSAHFRSPHGVDWIENDRVVVANRHGAVVVLPAPPQTNGVGALHVEPLLVIGPEDDSSDAVDHVATPGSVAARVLGPGIAEILVANNYIDTVSRHVIDLQRNSVLHHETVLASGLQIPDGLALSANGRWIAVSNHETHAVLIYEWSADLGPNATPVAQLRNVSYPHGLDFVAGDRLMVVADAGGPYVHLYASTEGPWYGDHQPLRCARVMTDEVYLAGRYNPQEGGPKGIAVHPGGQVVFLTSDQQVLAGFRLTDIAGHVLEHAVPVAPTDAVRIAFERAERYTDELREAAAVTDRHLAEAHQQAADARARVAALEASTSWRLTAPLRYLVDRVRRRR